MFNKGDRVLDNFAKSATGDTPRGELCAADKTRKGEIVETPDKWAVILWDGCKQPSQWSYEFLKKLPRYKTMTFQFSETQAIASQIAQLTQQLNQLATSLKPLQEREEKAENLRLQVAEYGHEMTDAGIPQSDILNWAKSLYSAASAKEIILGDSSAITTQNEIIADLKTQLASADTKKNQALKDLAASVASNYEVMALLDDATIGRDSANNELVRVAEENIRLVARNQELETLTDDMNGQLAEFQLMRHRGESPWTLSPEVEVLKQEIEELESANLNVGETGLSDDAKTGTVTYKFHNFQDGDRVEIANVSVDDDLEHLARKLGTVVGVKGNSVAVLVDATDSVGQKEVILSACHLKFISAKSPEIEAQTRGSEFIAGIRTKAGMNNITWTTISAVCQGNLFALREMVLKATTKYQRELVDIGNLSRLMADHVSETGDTTDFSWIDETFKSNVEALLEAKKSLLYHKDDWVRAVESGDIWQVKNFDGQWLSVKKGNTLASLHKSEVELVQQEVAA